MQKAGKRRARTTDRQRKALDLRIEGLSYEAIGNRLGITKQSAHELVMRALEEAKAQTAENVEKVRAMELRRADALLQALWKKRADPKAARAILGAMDRRAKLLGLDAPTKSALTDPDGNQVPTAPLEVRFVRPSAS